MPSNTTHDVRSPLASMVGYSSLLTQKSPPSTVSPRSSPCSSTPAHPVEHRRRSVGLPAPADRGGAGDQPLRCSKRQGLAGALTGIDAAPLFKDIVPTAKVPTVKIVLFTAHAELQARVEEQPAVDAFLLKTESSRLLTLAQRLTGLSST